MTIVYKKNNKTGEYSEFMINSEIFNAKDWVDISIDEYQISKIEIYRAEKIEDCKKFYDDLRYINAKNGTSIMLKCDQSLSNGIDSWLKAMKGKNENSYKFYIRKKVVIIIEEECIRLSYYIANIRNECATLFSFHTDNISLLLTVAEIENYDYKCNMQNIKIERFPDFIIKNLVY